VIDRRSPESLLRLFAGACDGRLQPDEQEQLAQLLASDERVREQYAEFTQLHTDLRFFAKAHRAGQRAIIGLSSQQDAETPSGHTSPIAPPIQLASESGPFTIGLSDAPSPINPNSGWWVGPAALTIPAIGAVTLVSLVALFFAFRSPRAAVDEAAPPLAAHDKQTPAANPSEQVLPRSPENSTLLARVHLDREETRFIPLGEIGHVLLEGPADMEFINPMRARLNQGRIKLRITSEKGRGFVVETPHGEVKDLGTEFGIDASQEAENVVVVFEGAVDLSIPAAKDASVAAHTERLLQGEGLTFNRRGRLSRIMSIFTGETATFEHGGDMRLQRWNPVIGNVTDNIIESNVRKFYEIVPGGMREDALTYVDRPAHEWNGIDERGMPSYLIDADYAKTFNDDKIRRDVEISVTLCRPATLYVFLDVRVPPPAWLVSDFHDTGDKVGLDNGPFYAHRYKKFANYARGVGPGQSIDEVFSVWKRIVPKPGIVKLGSNSGETWESGMYAFAAASLTGQGDDRTNKEDKPAQSVIGAP
jgi:hypothetical protein